MHRPQAYKSKADFVRAQPLSMLTADVIAAGKAAGLKITSADVHATRSNDRAKKAKAKKKPAQKPATLRVRPIKKPFTRPSAADDTMATLRKLALRTGVQPLRKLLDALAKEAGL